jgi:hypothetical protein
MQFRNKLSLAVSASFLPVLAMAQTTDPLASAVTSVTGIVSSTQADMIVIGAAVLVLIVVARAFKWFRKAL